MKNLFNYLDSLGGEVYLLAFLIIVYGLFFLWARKNWKESKHDESHSRTRYEKTAELDEELKRRRK